MLAVVLLGAAASREALSGFTASPTEYPAPCAGNERPARPVRKVTFEVRRLRAENRRRPCWTAPSEIGTAVPTKSTATSATTSARKPARKPAERSAAGTPGKPAPKAAGRRAPRAGAAKAVPLPPRLVEDDVQVDHAEHAARDAHLLDLLERISA